MIKVGLTGGIGSGKTYAASFFEQLGVPVYNSDTRAKALMDNNEEIRDKLTQAFGQSVYNSSGLDRSKLAQIVFNNKHNLEVVNNIVHPMVAADFNLWLHQHTQHTYIIKEAAILIESGAYKEVDKIVVIYAPLKLRIRRVMQRDGMTEEQVKKRISKQMPQDEKLKYADFMIENNGIQLVEQQVEKIHQQITQQYK
jgi:dephospho-CoA kinase